MEALILYFVLFFPGIYALPFAGNSASAGTIPFSALREFGRTLTYTAPSFALLWYLISGRRGLSALSDEKPRKRDLFAFIAGLPGLVAIGAGTSFLARISSDLTGFALPPKVEGPADIPGWLATAVSCLGSGYLEESYFRYYLSTTDSVFPRNSSWLEYGAPQIVLRTAFSTALFSLCHVYEGPWGVLNAALAGIFLSALFFRHRSFHGIAWAHGAYNVFVYAMGSLAS